MDRSIRSNFENKHTKKNQFSTKLNSLLKNFSKINNILGGSKSGNNLEKVNLLITWILTNTHIREKTQHKVIIWWFGNQI